MTSPPLHSRKRLFVSILLVLSELVAARHQAEPLMRAFKLPPSCRVFCTNEAH